MVPWDMQWHICLRHTIKTQAEYCIQHSAPAKAHYRWIKCNQEPICIGQPKASRCREALLWVSGISRRLSLIFHVAGKHGCMPHCCECFISSLCVDWKRLLLALSDLWVQFSISFLCFPRSSFASLLFHLASPPNKPREVR